MTEAEWLTSNDPGQMLRFAAEKLGANRRKGGRRKLRLFGCACSRQLWELMTDPRSRRAVEVAERLADDNIYDQSVEETRVDAAEARRAIALGRWQRTLRREGETRQAVLARGWLPDDEYRAAQSAAGVLERGAGNFAWVGLTFSCTENVPEYPIYFRRRCAQADALRCLFGNPFRSVPANPLWLAWNDGTVPKMAQAIYDDRAFDRLPVLADALEDAGCDNSDVLAHCRSGGEHVRGCWVVDLLLGKS